MAYENIEELLKKEAKPWEYNFEFEDAMIFENFKLGKNIFKRYFTHRASALKFSPDGAYPEAEEFIRSVHEKGYLKNFDCDSSPLAKNTYSALWSKCGFGSDTMNSVHKRLAELIKNIDTDKKADLKGNVDSRKYLTQCFVGENHEAFIAKLKNIDCLEKYIDLYHTLGNFVLVPPNFNTYRASKFKDYWDSSLECLRVAQFKENGFEWYINYFFLWDYVQLDKGSYKVNLIGVNEQTNKRDFPEFFKISTDLIKRRGKFMTAMLDIQHKKTDLYKEIQTFLTNKDKDFTAESIFDAAKKILENQELGKKITGNAKNLLVDLEEGKV